MGNSVDTINLIQTFLMILPEDENIQQKYHYWMEMNKSFREEISITLNKEREHLKYLISKSVSDCREELIALRNVELIINLTSSFEIWDKLQDMNGAIGNQNGEVKLTKFAQICIGEAIFNFNRFFNTIQDISENYTEFPDTHNCRRKTSKTKFVKVACNNFRNDIQKDPVNDWYENIKTSSKNYSPSCSPIPKLITEEELALSAAAVEVRGERDESNNQRNMIINEDIFSYSDQENESDWETDTNETKSYSNNNYSRCGSTNGTNNSSAAATISSTSITSTESSEESNNNDN